MFRTHGGGYLGCFLYITFYWQAWGSLSSKTIPDGFLVLSCRISEWQAKDLLLPLSGQEILILRARALHSLPTGKAPGPV